jgi:hypothetical protein
MEEITISLTFDVRLRNSGGVDPITKLPHEKRTKLWTIDFTRALRIPYKVMLTVARPD